MKIQKVKSTDGIGMQMKKTLGQLTFWFMVGFFSTFLIDMCNRLIANEQN
jgi:hypothetical protein